MQPDPIPAQSGPPQSSDPTRAQLALFPVYSGPFPTEGKNYTVAKRDETGRNEGRRRSWGTDKTERAKVRRRKERIV